MRTQLAEGRLWARAWFTEIVFVKVYVCVYFMNYFPFGFYKRLTTEKQLYRPCRLPGIAYPFKLERGRIPYLLVRK